MDQEILLNHFDMNSPGHQSCGLWRHPRDRSSAYTGIEYWTDLASTLERGLFDGIFLAEVSGVYDVYGGSADAALRTAMQILANDPFTLVPAMAAVTQHLCFGVTASIPYEHPYHFACRVSSLDHLRKGRFAWNVVTGYLDTAARTHGHRAQTAHDTRYEIAEEHMALVYKLWEGSWADDAVGRDRTAGVYTQPEGVFRVEHHGANFDLSAIHLCEPSPQRSPVIFHTRASPKGQAFAARHAECVFVAATNPAELGNTITGLRSHLQQSGREPEDLKVFALMSGWSGVDLSVYPLDEAVSGISTEAIQSVMRGSRTPREYGNGLAIGGAAPVLCGPPAKVADELQSWRDASGVDGFNLAYTGMPESVEAVVDLLVPERQARGLFKKRYAPGTMRDKLFGDGPFLRAPHPGAGYRRQK